MKTSRDPSWDIWVHMPMLTPTEAVALSLNVEPTQVSQRDLKTWTHPSGARSVTSISGFYDRLNLYTRCHVKPLSAMQLAAWTQSVGWDIPEKLALLAPVAAAPTLPPTPDDMVTKALLEVIGPDVSVGDLRREAERLGCRFVEIDGEPVIVIPNGMMQGEREPLSNSYSALCNLYASNPKAATLGSMLRATGASGSGARASSAWTGMSMPLVNPIEGHDPHPSAPSVEEKNSGNQTSLCPPFQRVEGDAERIELKKRIKPRGGDALTRLIWEICYDLADADEKPTPGLVMRELKIRAQSDDLKRKLPLMWPTTGGVQYEDIHGDDQELSSSQLKSRINEWKKAQE